MATIWNVGQLRVYQRPLKLLSILYELAHSLPESHQKLRRQIINCGEGIAPLIAEGFAKKEKHSRIFEIFGDGNGRKR